MFVDKDHCKLPTYNWLPKLHKRHYKSRFVANSILRGIKNATVKFCYVLHVAHRHELRKLNMTRSLVRGYLNLSILLLIRCLLLLPLCVVCVCSLFFMQYFVSFLFFLK